MLSPIQNGPFSQPNGVQGSGYLAACMAYMVQPGGHVLGLEKHQELANNSLVNIKKADGELLKSGVLEIRSGNALGGT